MFNRYDVLVAVLLVIVSSLVNWQLGYFLGTTGVILSIPIGFAIGWYGFKYWLPSEGRARYQGKPD